MKTLSYSSLESNSRKGVALIIVLSMLVLLSAVMVAFMGTVSTERLAQRAAYSGFEAHQAAESAVNLVMAQIRAATTESDDGSQSWASQPGVIRTFGQSSRVYKLYSHPRMQVTESSYQPDTLDESGINPTDLQLTPKGFVDLNQVVLTPGSTPGSVEPHYPIVDPRAALSRQGNDAEPGKGRVEGFWAPQSLMHFSRQRDQNNIAIRELPMRVQWLYQLRDGTFAAADPDSNKIPGADRKNPPVARVAFWTDDESSKININTAGENTYWDQPLASGYHESGDATSSNVDYSRGESAALSASQPTAGEFQRFPGHPATTNLSPALRWLYPPTMKDEDFKEALYRLTPRLRSGQGGSVSGTKANFDDSTPDYRYAKRDRLFATLDEFWFRPDRSPISDKGYFGVFRPTSASVVPDPTYVDSTATPKITPQALEQLRFFLTANSRAPELNLFGLPRVSIWPVHERDEILVSANSKRSGYDDLMAFCATVNGRPYYFTRAQPWSPTYDYEESGPESTEVTRDFPKRNKQLVLGTGGDGYLKRLGERNIPGAGGSFSSKYATPAPLGGFNEFDRILITIFDYIRSTNLIDTGRRDASETGYKLAYTPGYSPNQPPNYTKGAARVLGSGQVTPTVVYASPGQPAIKGFGRYVNLAEVGLLFYHDPSILPGTNEVAPPPSIPVQGTTDGTDVVSIRCVLIPEMVTVSGYYPGLCEGFAYRVRETTPLMISDASDAATPARHLELADNSFNFVDVNPWQIEYGRFWMPTRGWNNQFWTSGTGSGANKTAKKFIKPNLANGAAGYQNYPFYSKRFDITRVLKATGPQTPLSEFKLHGGTLEFEFYTLQVPATQTSNPPNAPAADTNNPIQKITVTFPEMTLPVPKKGSTAFQERIKSEAGDGGRSWMTTNDIVRTMEPNSLAVKGDYRHVAGLTNVPADYWEPSGNTKDEYKNKTIERLHNFRSGWGRGYENARYGKVANGATQRGGSTWNEKIAKIPARVGNRNYIHSMDETVTGDFDRGMSKHLDGAMINKPDEGNSRFSPGDNPAGGGHLPYYRGGNGYEEVGITFFSPNRLIASAVMFGSLPSGIFARRPWETLLFCPPTTSTHRGAASPADHYLLDWFHMPVVEPFAISEPLATTGKVNLNSRLAPFGYVKMPNGRSYIQRHTGLYGVFKRMRQLAVENGTANGGHNEEPLKETSRKFRFEVDPEWFVNEIIDPALDDRKYFKSATEVCELDLPLKSSFTAADGTAGKFKPKYKTGLADRKTFWENHNMTGDNSRERAYAHIYPRLTTKSNVYTVHVWAQSLAKTGNWDEFDETKDRIIGEYRGSTTFERYIDPKDPALDAIDYDAAEQPNAKSLDQYYRFRVINQKRFNPQ